MFHFTKPRYLSKWLDPVTQQTCPAYQFDVKVSDSAEEAGLSFLVEAGTELTVKVVEEAVQEDRDWWHTLLQHFLTTTASYFSRPYTVQHLERVVQHVEVSHASTEDTSLPRRIYCIPRLFQLSGGKLRIHWQATECPAGIDLPEEETASDVLAIPPVCGGQDRSAEIEEWDVEALPEEKEDTDNASLVTNPDMLLERQRVKEARLKAKLAVYRAQYQMNRFYDKYGNEVSDSDSEEEEDEEDEEEDEEEEVSFL